MANLIKPNWSGMDTHAEKKLNFHGQLGIPAGPHFLSPECRGSETRTPVEGRVANPDRARPRQPRDGRRRGRLQALHRPRESAAPGVVVAQEGGAEALPGGGAGLPVVLERVAGEGRAGKTEGVVLVVGAHPGAAGGDVRRRGGSAQRPGLSQVGDEHFPGHD